MRRLRSEPIPLCHGSSQALVGVHLFRIKRHRVPQRFVIQGGDCIARFRPGLVFHTYRGKGFDIAVKAHSEEIEAKELIR